MTDATTEKAGIEAAGDGAGRDPRRPVELHPLVYLTDGDEVTIGRQDTDSYAIFPPDGAELVRKLASGTTPGDAARWYEATYGEPVDLDDVLASLDELGFVRSAGEPAAAAAPVRWRRLGAALFSPPAWIAYALLVGWALAAMVRRPDLVPRAGNVFFTEYYMVIQVVLFVAAVPQLLLHESFHALAGRRLGLRSSLRLDRRLYYLVLETSLDGLVSVPRRRRYLPILAGMLADVLVIAALTIAADLSRAPDGSFPFWGRACLAIVFAVLLRVLWQFSFYLRTDLYVLISTTLGCVDLHTTAKRLLGNRVNRLLGRHERLVDESTWHPVDRRAARWYAWLIVVGYTISLGTFLLAIVPITYRMVASTLGRIAGGGTDWTYQLDSVVFAIVSLAQLAVVGWLALRDRRRRRRERRLHHVIA